MVSRMVIQNVAVVIAAYNEEGRVGTVIHKTSTIIPKKHIIIVDDGSKDGTTAEAKKAGATVISYKKNKGKGNAMRVGCDYALQKKYKYIVVMDADGQHDPKDIPSFVTALQDKDIVFGIRTGKKAPWVFKLGNYGLTFGIYLLSGLPIKDSQGGFRAFNVRAYKQIRWDANDYFVETEMIMRAKGLRYAQIPIQKVYLDAQKGTTVSIGLKIGWNAAVFFVRNLFKKRKKKK